MPGHPNHLWSCRCRACPEPGSKRTRKRRRAAWKPCCELCERSLPGRQGRRDFRTTRESEARRFELAAG